ncbi:hypothetical protein ANN_22061 [Periplaneta americana]|uniref:Uncharacterized protein n=1 Tax=Periplaneta americana TaxID=6978 RepID=A0ABQ8S7G8_PERAM|nr:hypothetical protein ANN_22061 [Periplaneta americana]
MAGLCESGNEPPDSLMVSGVEKTRKLPSICSHGVEGKPRKKPKPVTCPDRESSPGHLVSRPDALTKDGEKDIDGKSNLQQTNDEIRKKCGVQDVTKWIKTRRKVWRDNVLWMTEDRLPKIAMKGNMDTPRPLGGPPKRWKESWTPTSD